MFKVIIEEVIMNKILVYNADGIQEEKEVLLVLKTAKKNYILYRDIDGEDKKIYASYYFDENNNDDILNLNNDLSEEEYSMFEELYNKGSDSND